MELRPFTIFHDLFPTTNLPVLFPQKATTSPSRLVGFAFFDYLTVSLSAFDNSIVEAQQNGTLEAMLVTETPLTMILVASAAYPFVLARPADRDLPGVGSAALSFSHSAKPTGSVR